MKNKVAAVILGTALLMLGLLAPAQGFTSTVLNGVAIFSSVVDEEEGSSGINQRQQEQVEETSTSKENKSKAEGGSSALLQVGCLVIFGVCFYRFLDKWVR